MSKRFFSEFEDQYKIGCWSDKNELKPYEATYGSNKKFKFDCKKCGHEFQVPLGEVTKRNRWCPYCSNRRLCGKEECVFCFDKSFASFHDKEKLNCWSDNNELKPYEIHKSSDKKIKFDCNKCAGILGQDILQERFSQGMDFHKGLWKISLEGHDISVPYTGNKGSKEVEYKFSKNLLALIMKITFSFKTKVL